MSEQENEIMQRLTRVETKLDFLLTDPNREKRLSDLEDNQRWLWRALFSTIFAGVVSYVLKL